VNLRAAAATPVSNTHPSNPSPVKEIGASTSSRNPTAQNREGGLGGIIDLKTRSPLSQEMGLNLGGNARGTKATDAEGGVTPVGTLVGGFKFSDDLRHSPPVCPTTMKRHTTSSSRTKIAVSGWSRMRPPWILRRQSRRQHEYQRCPAVGPTSIRSSPTSPTSSIKITTRCDRWRRMEVERGHHEHLQLFLHPTKRK